MDTARSRGKLWPCLLCPLPQAVTLKYLLNKCCKPCPKRPLLDGQVEAFPPFGWITPASYGPSGVPSLKWLRAVSQIRHANASPVVQFRVTARSGGHVKKRIRSRESDIYLICTQRAPVIDTSNHKDRFGRSVDSPAIRDQADEL